MLATLFTALAQSTSDLATMSPRTRVWSRSSVSSSPALRLSSSPTSTGVATADSETLGGGDRQLPLRLPD